MKTTSMILLIALAALLTGCGETHVYAEGTTSSAVYIEPSFPAELNEFQIIDSYNVSTKNATPAILDPYIDNGVFDIYWSTHSTRDYIVEYYINDIPSINGGMFIDAELCGVDLPCNNRGGDSFCQYYSDFSVSCSVATPIYNDANSALTPVVFDQLIQTIPQTLYFILQVCDTTSANCEYDYKPVTMF